MAEVAEHVAGGLWITHEIDERLQVLGQFYSRGDFDYAMRMEHRRPGLGLYAFNQTGLHISGQRSGDLEAGLERRVNYILSSVYNPEMSLPLLDKDMVDDFAEEMIRTKSRPLGFGAGCLQVLTRVVQLDIESCCRR